MLNDLIVAGAVFCFSWAAVAYVRRWALRNRVLDVPNERSSHQVPVPRAGGMAIVATVILGMSIALAAQPVSSPRIAIAWMFGSLLVAVVSWFDDLRSLPTLVRLLAHATAAVVIIAAAGPFMAIGQPAVGFLRFSVGGYLLTLFWIVGLTNAFNFMDGIDGIAAGQATVAAVAAAILGRLQNEPAIEMLGVLIAAGSVGFLVHNWSPATIFMGDVGSAFLGYSLAVLPLMSRQSHPAFLLQSVLALWPFLFDAIFTFARRLLKGENVMQAHRSHLYQRLVTTGLSHAAVAALYIAMAATSAGLGLLTGLGPAYLVAAIGSIAAMAAGLWVLVRVREIRAASAEQLRASRHPACGES